MTTYTFDAQVVGQIRTFTGRYVDPLNLEPDDVTIEDVAWSLAHVCRFNGHTRTFWTVAQHSLAVAERVPEHRLAALLHDASEAYLGDMVRPIKNLPAMAVYRQAHDRAEQVIAARFGLGWPWPVEVMDADVAQLLWEFEHVRDVMGRVEMPWAVARRFREAIEGAVPC